MSKLLKMQHCFNCGAELGVYAKLSRDHDTCGKIECEREARDAYAQEREEAHRDLDERMGWD